MQKDNSKFKTAQRSTQLDHMRPRAGEVLMKQFVLELAEKIGVSASAVYNRIHRGRLSGIRVRAVNKRVVFIKPIAEVAIDELKYAPKPGEVTQTEFLRQEAAKRGMKPAGLLMRFVRGKEPWPPRRKVGHWTWVQTGQVN